MATGKQFPGQTFVAVTTPEDVKAKMDANKPYASPDAVDLSTYFAVSNIRDPVLQASMRAYTQVTRATLADWSKIFQAF